jgi:hypothetical protein
MKTQKNPVTLLAVFSIWLGLTLGCSSLRKAMEEKRIEREGTGITRRIMNIKRNLFAKTATTILLTLVTFSFAHAQHAAQAQRAINTVAALYKANKIKSIAKWNKVELKKYFDSKLANAIYKVTHGEDGIDFDILYNTQDDSNIKNFKISGGDFYHDSYIVSVHFKNFSKEKDISYTLNENFKVEEVEYIGHGSLMDILTNSAK